MCTQITLENDECALVVSKKTLKRIIPKELQKDGMKAPIGVIILDALFTAIGNDDPHFRAIVNNYIESHTNPPIKNGIDSFWFN